MTVLLGSALMLAYCSKVGDHLEPIDSGYDVEIGGGNVVLNSDGSAAFQGSVNVGSLNNANTTNDGAGTLTAN